MKQMTAKKLLTLTLLLCLGVVFANAGGVNPINLKKGQAFRELLSHLRSLYPQLSNAELRQMAKEAWGKGPNLKMTDLNIENAAKHAVETTTKDARVAAATPQYTGAVNPARYGAGYYAAAHKEEELQTGLKWLGDNPDMPRVPESLLNKDVVPTVEMDNLEETAYFEQYAEQNRALEPEYTSHIAEMDGKTALAQRQTEELRSQIDNNFNEYAKLINQMEEKYQAFSAALKKDINSATTDPSVAQFYLDQINAQIALWEGAAPLRQETEELLARAKALRSEGLVAPNPGESTPSLVLIEPIPGALAAAIAAEGPFTILALNWERSLHEWEEKYHDYQEAAFDLFEVIYPDIKRSLERVITHAEN